MTISVSSSSQSQMQSQKKIGAMDKVPQQRLYDPGLYQLTKELQQPIKYEQKNTGFFGFVGKLVVGTIILGATAGLTRKYTSLSKSTTIRHLMGFSKPQEGSTKIFDKETFQKY